MNSHSNAQVTREPLKTKEELYSFARQVLDDELNFDVESYSIPELKEIHHLLGFILTEGEER